MKIDGQGGSGKWKWFNIRPASGSGEITPVQPVPKVTLPERSIPIIFGPEIKAKIKGEALFAGVGTKWDLFLDRGWVFSKKVLEILFEVLKVESNANTHFRVRLNDNKENKPLKYAFMRNDNATEINSYPLSGQTDFSLNLGESLVVLDDRELMYLITNSGNMDEDPSKIVLALGTNNDFGLQSSNKEFIPLQN